MRESSPAWLVQPSEHVLVGIGGERRAIYQVFERQPQQIIGAHLTQCAAVATEWGANTVVEVGVVHGEAPSSVSSVGLESGQGQAQARPATQPRAGPVARIAAGGLQVFKNGQDAPCTVVLAHG